MGETRTHYCCSSCGEYCWVDWSGEGSEPIPDGWSWDRVVVKLKGCYKENGERGYWEDWDTKAKLYCPDCAAKLGLTHVRNLGRALLEVRIAWVANVETAAKLKRDIMQIRARKESGG